MNDGNDHKAFQALPTPSFYHAPILSCSHGPPLNPSPPDAIIRDLSADRHSVIRGPWLRVQSKAKLVVDE